MSEKTINLNILKKAVNSLREILEKNLDNSVEAKFIRDGAIQRFEYTYELAWKTLKRVLTEYFYIQEPFTIKDLYREAGRVGIIDSVENWFEYHKARNETSHIYAENIADKTYEAAQKFLPDAEKLLHNLEKMLNDST